MVAAMVLLTKKLPDEVVLEGCKSFGMLEGRRCPAKPGLNLMCSRGYSSTLQVQNKATQADNVYDLFFLSVFV